MLKHCGVLLFFRQKLLQPGFQFSGQRLRQEMAQNISRQCFFKKHGLLVEIQRIQLIVSQSLNIGQCCVGRSEKESWSILPA